MAPAGGLREPGLESRVERGIVEARLLFEHARALPDRVDHLLDRRVPHHDRRARHARIGNLPRLVHAVEEAEEAEVFLLRQRVVLVIVAARALRADAEERAPERVDAIDDVLRPVFLRDDAAFLALHVIAIEAGRENLLVGRVREQIAGELPRDELIERQIAIEGAESPSRATATSSACRRPDSHASRHSARRRASRRPCARRSAATPAGDRRAARTHPAPDRRGTDRSRRSSAEAP